MDRFEAHGKFLISGEYFILHGAQGLALPLTKMKQWLEVEQTTSQSYQWIARETNGPVWFRVDFDEKLEIQSSLDPKIAQKLQSILREIRSLKPHLFEHGRVFETQMNFSAMWGLGSSSTLISLLSQWSGVDEFYLQKAFFGGSGYDIACATSDSPLLYRLEEGKPCIRKILWSPDFRNHLHFIYLGKKKDSRIAMEEFKKNNNSVTAEQITIVNDLTTSFVEATTLGEFQSAIHSHEKFISERLGISPIKEHHFADFEGEVKSLGGWGGDFIMAATSLDETYVKSYFSTKQLPLVLRWEDLLDPTQPHK